MTWRQVEAFTLTLIVFDLGQAVGGVIVGAAGMWPWAVAIIVTAVLAGWCMWSTRIVRPEID